MKAAVIYGKDQLPEYTDFPEPVPQKEHEILVSVKAVAIKHFDKQRASGKHYSANTHQTAGRVIGGDGVGLLADGTRIYAPGITGMLAEKALVDKNRMVVVPDALDDSVAAALPNAVAGSAMALRYKANIRAGDTVLINGATGFTGRVAIQVAKYYGAHSVIVTGRNFQSLQELMLLGADEWVQIDGDDAAFMAKLKALDQRQPVDIILDYLWGHSAALILDCLKGDGSFTNKRRYVSVGSVTGDQVNLSSAILRSVNMQLSGSGLGAWSEEELHSLFNEILPDMFELAVAGKLIIKTTTVALKDINDLWQLHVPGGQRLVVHI